MTCFHVNNKCTDRRLGRKMSSVEIYLLITEAVVHKVMGKHYAGERNHVWNIF